MNEVNLALPIMTLEEIVKCTDFKTTTFVSTRSGEVLNYVGTSFNRNEDTNELELVARFDNITDCIQLVVKDNLAASFIALYPSLLAVDRIDQDCVIRD